MPDEIALNDLIFQIIDMFEDRLWDKGRVGDDEFVFDDKDTADYLEIILKGWLANNGKA